VLFFMAVTPRKRNPLDRWLQETTVPVYLIGADRKLQYFNAGCEQLTGYTADELLGQVCHFGSQTGATPGSSLLGTLCPPPDVFAGEEQQLPTYLLPKHGASLARMIHFFPLREGPRKITGVLGVISPLKPPAVGAPPSAVTQQHAALAALRGSLRQRFQEQNLIASGPEMKKIVQQLELAIPNRCGVLLRGEPGTGKEHLARVMHYAGPLKQHWFVPLECAKLDADELTLVLTRLLEVHRTESARGGTPQPGTVYLADIDHLPRDLQAQLAEALAVHAGHAASVERAPGLRFLGGISTASGSTGVRPDLEAALSTLTLVLPPLRERETDFPLLVQGIIEELNPLREQQLSGITPAALQQFQQYDWPGNLDELRLVLQEGAAAARGTQIDVGDLPFRFRTALQAREFPPALEPRPLPLDDLLLKVERNAVLLALERCKYNKSQAADVLGINRARLYRRMEQLGIEDRESPAT